MSLPRSVVVTLLPLLATSWLTACRATPSAQPTPIAPPAATSTSVAPAATVTPTAGSAAVAEAAPTAPTTGAASDEPAPAERVRVANTDGWGANLRAEPGVGAPTLKAVGEGTALEVIGQDRQADDQAWRGVRDPSDGASGWVAAELVEPIDAHIPTAAEPEATAARTADPRPAPGGSVAPRGADCPLSHPIKAGRGGGVWTYHTRMRPSYGSTIPHECFATASEAQAAGYRQSPR